MTAPTPTPTLLNRVRVLDFATGGFTRETSMLIDSGRIRWIGPPEGRGLPRGTVTVDAGGRFAIPGLFDMHGHGDWCGRPTFIEYGVTSMRNMGGRIETERGNADRGDFTSSPTPRCFYAGRILEGPEGRNDDHLFVHVFDEADARSHVRLWKAQGAQFIKLYERLSWPLQRAAADEAHRLGLPVAAHGITVEQVVKGVTMGYASLSHWERFYDDALQMFAAAGTQWDANLAGRSGLEVVYRNEPARYPLSSLDVFRPFGDNALLGAWYEMLHTTQAAFRRGVKLIAGTDGTADGKQSTSAHQWELVFLAEAGIPPLDVLRMATQASAQAVGAQDHLGTLDVGKLADLLLLDANPLEDIKNTQKIWRVFKGGWMFDPKVLRSAGQ